MDISVYDYDSEKLDAFVGKHGGSAKTVRQIRVVNSTKLWSMKVS